MAKELTEQSHEMRDFMLTLTREIAYEYERIQKRVMEDPGTAGDQGEENWATLLRNWLPPHYKVVTKGRILRYQGVTSPQVDVIVLSPAYPTQLLDKKLYLAGGVVAAFECKLTLRSGHLEKAFKNAVLVQRLLAQRTGSPYRELNSPIIYGLLAHSHAWNSDKPGHEAAFKISREMGRGFHAAEVRHPREALDFVCGRFRHLYCF